MFSSEPEKTCATRVLIFRVSIGLPCHKLVPQHEGAKNSTVRCLFRYASELLTMETQITANRTELHCTILLGENEGIDAHS